MSVPEIYKAVIQRESLYVKTRSGVLAVANLTNDVVRLHSLPNRVRNDIWDAWDIDKERIAFAESYENVTFSPKLRLIGIDKLPAFDQSRASPPITNGEMGEIYVNIPGMLLVLDEPSKDVRPSPNDPALSDVCFDKTHRLVAAGGFKNILVVKAYEQAAKPLQALNFVNQQAVDLSPFVVLSHPQGALMIEINGGREVEVTENAFKVAKPAVEDPQSKAADDAYAVVIVDKRGDKFSVLRCSVARDGSKVVALATKDAPPATQPIETDKLTKALGRAVAALNKAGAFEKPAK